MKHARQKPGRSAASKNKSKSRSPQSARPRTEADFRKKYYSNDHIDEVEREIARAGYKPRSLDSYIPKTDSGVPKRTRRSTSDATARIDTAKIAAAQNDMKRRKTTSKNSSQTAKASTKKGSQSKRKEKEKKTKGSKRRIFAKIAAVFGIALFIAAIIFAGICAGMYSAVSNELKEMNVQNLALNYSSFVYYNDKDGNAHELTQLHYEGDRRVWADSSEISKHLKNAAVAIEDERFYEHNGFDLRRTISATVLWGLEKVGIGKSSYGGSTITQQLVKNITNEKDKTATRKIKEIMRAVALEKQLNDKDAILTMYLNVSFFSNQCYGVEAASNLYFSKSAADVSIAEAAMIVGITQRPSYFNPIKNPENALNKRNVVLSKMYELGFITEEEYNNSKDLPLGLAKSATSSKKTVYSYFVDQVINDVKADLIEQKGYSETFAEQQVFSGGLKIYTTMDKDVQDAMESVFENRTGFPKNSKPQAAMVVMDQYTGEVKGLVGGAGKKTESRGLIRATQSRRQPGSSFKPISVYAPGIELGKINTATVLRDEKITIGDWSPVNSYTGFKGDMILRRAIEISANIPAVKALQILGIENSYKYASDHFGINLVNDDKSLASMALGGLTNGVTTMEMAAAYSAFANEGVYTEPYTYTKVLDSAGRVLLETKPKTKRAISKTSAFIMTDLLNEVIYGSSGTGKAARLANNMPAYGKTGTTNENKDKWFVGYTKYYVGAVWFGFDTPANLRNAGITNNPSCTIWKTVMDKIHQGLEPVGYEAPSTVKQLSICSKTGKLASSGCGYAVSEYFVAGSTPSKFCKLSHGHEAPSTAPSSSPSNSDAPNESASSGESITLPDSTPAASSEPTHTATPGAPASTPPPASTPSDVISLD